MYEHLSGIGQRVQAAQVYSGGSVGDRQRSRGLAVSDVQGVHGGLSARGEHSRGGTVRAGE